MLVHLPLLILSLIEPAAASPVIADNGLFPDDIGVNKASAR
jgi:hypothetical protein